MAVILDLNRRPGYSLILRENYFITITGAATVYQIDAGKEPVTLYTGTGTKQIGPFAGAVRPLMVQVNSGTVSVSDPEFAIGGGDGGPVTWDDIQDKPDNLATTDDITEARAFIVPLVIDDDATIDADSHTGQTILADATIDINVTLADDLPANSSGTIVQIGEGAVTVLLETGDPVTATGKVAATSGPATAIQWLKTANGVYVFGGLADVA